MQIFAFGFIYWLWVLHWDYLPFSQASKHLFSNHVCSGLNSHDRVYVCVCMHLSRPAYMTSETNTSLWTETLQRCTNHFTSTPSQSAAEFDEVCFISCCLGSDRSLLRSHTQPNTLLMVSVLSSSFHSIASKLKIRPSDNHPAQMIFYLYLVSVS